MIFHRYSSISDCFQDSKSFLGFQDDALFWNFFSSFLKYHCADQKTFNPLDALVYMKDEGRNIPFYLANDYLDKTKKCVIPLMSGYYEYYKPYHEVIKKYPSAHIGIGFPIVTREGLPETFRKYLSTVKDNKVPHFFGQKSKEVSWEYIPNSDKRALDTMYKLMPAFLEHSFLYQSKYKDDDRQVLVNLIQNWVDNINTEGGIIVATDTELNEPICAMYLLRVGNTVHCEKIASSKSEKYKKYSLVLNAHLASIRSIFYSNDAEVNLGHQEINFNGVDTVDFGINFDDQAYAYKQVLPHSEFPIFNFTENIEVRDE